MWSMWHTLDGTEMHTRFLWENMIERDFLEDLRHTRMYPKVPGQYL